MIIHINGMPGIGKFTTAKLLAEKLDARLIDNHLILDLVLNLCERGDEEYFRLIGKFTDVILEEVSSKRDHIFIFTNALSAGLAEDRERLDYLKIFAENEHLSLVQILLTCDLEENKRRIISENRKLKGKLTNAEDLDEIYKNHTIYHPSAEFALQIDATNLSAFEVSEKIKDFIEKIIKS
jgi:deoxyadenosine/deoxycytidine kinase